MNPPLVPVENLPDVFARNTTSVPVYVANRIQFACDALDHLPLAESVLLLWQQVGDPKFLQDLFDRQRGRGYDKILSFPSLVQLIADALLQHDGSARASFERALAHDALPATIPAAYGKLRRRPIAFRTPFLAQGPRRLHPLRPRPATSPRTT